MPLFPCSFLLPAMGSIYMMAGAVATVLQLWGTLKLEVGDKDGEAGREESEALMMMKPLSSLELYTSDSFDMKEIKSLPCLSHYDLSFLLYEAIMIPLIWMGYSPHLCMNITHTLIKIHVFSLLGCWLTIVSLCPLPSCKAHFLHEASLTTTAFHWSLSLSS